MFHSYTWLNNIFTIVGSVTSGHRIPTMTNVLLVAFVDLGPKSCECNIDFHEHDKVLTIFVTMHGMDNILFAVSIMVMERERERE